MKVSDLIVSKYLAKTDFDDDQIATIKKAQMESLGREDQQEDKLILYFREYPKGMVMNNTSLKVLAQAYGDDIDGWTGKQVTIYVDPNVSFGGKVVGGLRLRPMKTKTAAKPAPAAAAKDFDDDLDSEVPF